MVQEQISALPEAFTVIASWILPWAAEPSVQSPQLLQPGNGLKAAAALCFPTLSCEECLEVGTKQTCHNLPFVTSQDLMMDGWMEMQPPTHPEALPGCRSPGSKQHPRDTSREEGTGLHELEDALSKARPSCTGKEQSMLWGMQQPQTALIQGFEQALSTEPARLDLKQETFLQSDKITSDPEKRPLFPSAEMPGKGAGRLMNYETLGKGCVDKC